MYTLVVKKCSFHLLDCRTPIHRSSYLIISFHVSSYFSISHHILSYLMHLKQKPQFLDEMRQFPSKFKHVSESIARNSQAELSRRSSREAMHLTVVFLFRSHFLPCKRTGGASFGITSNQRKHSYFFCRG